MTDRRDTDPGFVPNDIDAVVARDFFLMKASWLRPVVVEVKGGWDVLLRVDGTYQEKSVAQDAAEHIQTRWLDKIYGERS